jgi:arylsulfatase A-like enzyme
MVAGTLELAAFLAKCVFLDPRNFNVSRHFPWMFPAAGILLLGGPGLALALAARLWPGHGRVAWVLCVLLFPALLGFLLRWPVYTAVCLLLAAALAWRGASWLAPHAARFDRLVRRSLPVFVGILLAVAAFCNGRQRWAEHRALARLPQGHIRAPNVILVVLDTVRADSLSLDGDPRDTTPNLARLAARGVRFNLAFATAPWTAPSHASIFTGRWRQELSVGWNRPLDATSPTLAEFLGSKGYATAGFVGNTIYCSYETGLDRGFAHYEDYDVSLRAVLLCSALLQRTVSFIDRHPALPAAIGLGGTNHRSSAGRKSAARINRDFLAWLDRHEQRSGGRPFFAFLNYFDAHHPYFPPASDAECEEGEAGTLGWGPTSRTDLRLIKEWWEVDKRRLVPGEVALARAAYERCITSMDRELGRLFEDLERRGVLRNSLVIVTADHGEHFGEQGLFGHGCSLYLPELHVPLLIVCPGEAMSSSAGRVVATPVSLRDIPATIVSALGTSIARGSPFPGRSLLEEPRGEPVLSELDSPPESDPNHGASPVCRGPLVSLVDRGFHYIRSADGREELFDIENDRGETVDLARDASADEVLRRFRQLHDQRTGLRHPLLGFLR